MQKRNSNCRKKLIKSQGFLKVKNYFLDLIERKDFQDEVKKIRIKYTIPPKGFSKKEKHLYPEPPEYGPKYPKRWDKLIKEPIDQFLWMELFEDEKKIGEKFQLPAGSLNILDDYVLYNATSKVDSDTPSLCMTQDCHELGEFKEIDEENEVAFPITIRISPYATERDILDYVRVAYSGEIEPLQKKYADKTSKIGKVRAKKNRERDNFIYEHRHLKTQEIIEMLPKEWRGIGYSEINTAIRQQRVKRKEV
jgi:hypothetical protein